MVTPLVLSSQPVAAHPPETLSLSERITSLTGLSSVASNKIVEVSDRYQIPIPILLGLFQVESSFNPDAVNPESGAAGLGQFEHGTGKVVASRCGLEYSYSKLFDPVYNIELTANYLSYLHDQTGSWEGALTAYNYGLGGYFSHVKKTGQASSSYSRRVMECVSRYQTLAN